MKGFVNQEAVLALVSRRLGDFLGDRAVELSRDEAAAVPLSFYGISQGAILGAGYTEFSSLVRQAGGRGGGEGRGKLSIPKYSRFSFATHQPFSFCIVFLALFQRFAARADS